MTERLVERATGLLLVLGTLVAGYLTYEHFTGNATLACSATGVVDCASVTTSKYSYLVGIPVALLGLGWFLASLALWAVSRARLGWAARNPVQLLWTGAGLAFVLYLVWVELVPLGKICSWCTVVHVTVLAIFLLRLAGQVLVDDE
ncbi:MULTISPECIES: vitamin K epoxide reductase family protein [unclassified Luteococcus]|uniref:vitamin K epoxide reductase family protein n=1 Tax=unclassified Luteococcus TaxID=2639923 RepID=UPI00313BE491